MTNPIERAAINAAAHWLFADDAPCVEGCACDMSRPEAESILEAAMPHIRKQIAEEIIAKLPSHDSTLRVSPPHFEDGFNTGMKYAARIAEGENK